MCVQILDQLNRDLRNLCVESKTQKLMRHSSRRHVGSGYSVTHRMSAFSECCTLQTIFVSIVRSAYSSGHCACLVSVVQLCCSPAVDSAPVVHLSAFTKKHGVVSGSIGLFTCACFQATIFSFCHSVLHLHLFRDTQVVSRSSSILRVWSGTTRIRFWVGRLTSFSVCVQARFVMFCGNVISHGLQSVFVLLSVVLPFFVLMGLVTFARQ